MPIRRKICKVGTGLAVFLPKSWVQLLEEKHGPVEAVEIEVDGSLKISNPEEPAQPHVTP